jgi:hypothetical protein
MKTLKLDHWINDRVHIPELNRNGKVVSIFIGDDCRVQYNVRGFKDGEPKTTYFHADELTEPKEPAALGFKEDA